MIERRNCPAPAKLNLFLHVVGQRTDGYHLIESLFQLIDLADTLHFKARSDGQVRRVTTVDGVPEDTDLCVRAARLLQATTGTTLGVDIEIEKRIPMGGGLGGGSSDAATTLLVLNQLWELGLKRSDLMRLGLQLGADVPFFVFGQNAFVAGIGEQMTPLVTPARCFAVVHPGVAVPTAAIFTAPELTRNHESLRISDFSAYPVVLAEVLTTSAFWDETRNDLEPVAVKRFPEVGQALQWLTQNAGSPENRARMSGSGACVFVLLDESVHESAAGTAATNGGQPAWQQRLPAGWRSWMCQTLPEHPLRFLAMD